MKPRYRVKARSRMYGNAVPDDAQPGDLVIGNRGAAALVVEAWTSNGLSSCLTLEYVGNWYLDPSASTSGTGRRVYDFSGGTRP